MTQPCPKCTLKVKCVDSRPKVDGTVQRRFRCESCGCKFSSVEVIISIDDVPFMPQLNDHPNSNSKRLTELVMRHITPTDDPVELMQALINEISRTRS